MRGNDHQQEEIFSYVSSERRVRQDHPLRRVRAMTDAALQQMSPEFDALYARAGRPSIAPEKLLRTLLLQALYSVRSERLLDGKIAELFFDQVVAQADQHSLLSDEHFTVDGTMIEA